MPDWSIIIHGGAKTIKPEEEAASRAAAREAVECGAAILRSGGSALDAVEQSIKVMESGGVFNAGRGSVLRANGKIQMDASIMDGKLLEIGAVSGLENVENPISVARALLPELPILLAGQHANEFALARGFPVRKPNQKPGAPDASCDTVGCVARDATGDIAVGLSTGGLTGAMPGRVGDAPLPGCGFYADNARAGLCFSGDGESIARITLAAEVLHRLDRMSPQDAIDSALTLLARVNGEAGCILIDREGRPAWAHNSTHFAIAWQTSDSGKPVISLRKAEDSAAA